MTAGTRIAIYARVSTKAVNEKGERKQSCDTQLQPMRDFCKQRGWEVAAEYLDDGVSGSKASRPALNRLMADAVADERKFDAVLVWKLDRFGRSIRHLFETVATLDAKGIKFVSMTDGFDMTTAQGRLMFNMLSSFAEFERELIRERVTAGIKRAQASGKPRGAGRHRTVVDWADVRTRIKAGETRKAIADSLKVSPSLITKWLKASA